MPYDPANLPDYNEDLYSNEQTWLDAKVNQWGMLIGGIIGLGSGLYYVGTIMLAEGGGAATVVALTLEEQAAAAGMPLAAFKFLDAAMKAKRPLTVEEGNLIRDAIITGKWIGAADTITGLMASIFPNDYNTVARPVEFTHMFMYDAPNITLTTNKEDAEYGDSLSFTANVTGEIAKAMGLSAGALANAIIGFPTNMIHTLRPTGTVQFTCDGAALGDPVALSETGVAYSPFITTLTVGTHNIGAAYSGDDNFDPITKLYVQTVAARQTAIRAYATPNPYSNTYGGTLPAFRVFATVLKKSDGSIITNPPGQLRFRVSTNGGASFTTISSKDINNNGSANQDVYIVTGVNLLVRCVYVPTGGKYLTSQDDFVEKWNSPPAGSFPSEFTIRPVANFEWAGAPGFASSPVYIRDGYFYAQFEITCPNNWTGDVYIPTNSPLVPSSPFMTEYVGGAIVWSGIPSIYFNAGTFRITNGVGTFTINAVGGRGGTNYNLNNWASGLINLAIRNPENPDARPTMKWNDRGLIYTAFDTTSFRLSIL